MRSVARLAMRGPYHAASLAAAFLLAAPVVAFLLVPSGALIALATLRHGAASGLRVLVTAAVIAAGVRFVLSGDVAPQLLLGGLTWVPAWSMALVLGQRRQQVYPLLVAAALVAVYALAMRLLVGDVAAYWSAHLAPLFELLARDAGARFTPQQVAYVAGQLHLWSLVGIQVLLSGMILLARWWQAVLYNPGGFGSEFRELALPRAALFALGVAAALLLLDRAGTAGLAGAGDACVILMVLFAFQGLAVVHYRAKVRSLASGWLAGMYVLLVLMPQLAGPLLASTGVADSVVDWRHLRRPRHPALPPTDEDAQP